MILNQVLFWCAVALISLGAYLYRPGGTLLWQSDLFLLLGAIFLLLVLWRLRHEQSLVAPMNAQPAPPRTHGRVHYVLIGAGAFCLLLLAERNGYVFEMEWLVEWFQFSGQMGLLVGGILLLLLGVGGVRFADLRRFGAWLWLHRWSGLLLLGVTLIGLIPRLWQLETAVPTLMDEGPFISEVVHLRYDPYRPLLHTISGIASFTRIYPYFQFVSAEVFGSTIFAFRAVSALVGALTIPAVYGLARLLFNRPTAWIAALLLATFPPHIHLSRTGINNIADPLPGVLALMFLVLAIRKQHQLYYALSGAMIGLLPYFYEGGELLFTALSLLWIGWLLLFAEHKPTQRGLLWFVLVAMLVAFPVYYTNASLQIPFFARLNETNIGSDFWSGLLFSDNVNQYVQYYLRNQLLPPLLHYIHAPDGSLFYGGETALILTPLAPLFLLGLVYAVVRWRDQGMLLMGWVLLTALGNSLIETNAWTARFVVVMPALVILIASGLVQSVRLLRIMAQRTIDMPRRLQSLLYLLTLLIALGQVRYYFDEHLIVYNRQITRLAAFYDVVWRAMDEHPAGTVVYVMHNDYTQGQFVKFIYDYLGVSLRFEMLQADLFQPQQLDDGLSYAFYINPETIHIAYPKIRLWWETAYERVEVKGGFVRYYHYNAPYGTRTPLE